jgi:cysteine desulfurase
MAPFEWERFANASSSHAMGRDARKAVEEAREEVAAFVGAHPAEVVFTSGGTEADNLAVFGALAGPVPPGERRSAVCSAIEHSAVLEPLRAAARGSAAVLGVGSLVVREIGATATGMVDLAALAEALDGETRFVSAMTANNEVGTVQPLAEIATLTRRRAPHALLHTDAVQAARFLDLASVTAGFDLVTLTAHKLGGPKGVGALIVRAPATIAPTIYGGGQERERRSGTSNVAGIVGLAAAVRVVAARRDAESARIRELRDALADRLVAGVPGVLETVPRDSVLPGHCHVRIGGVDHEELLVLLDAAGVCASGGSACASGALEPSHVLVAMGLSRAEARSGVRFSLGYTTTPEDVDRTVTAVVEAVERLLT